MSLERLEFRIRALATEIHAKTCEWLQLVAEFDRREGWAGWGCRSCAHWLSWQTSVGLGSAREHVRVARRLEELPLIREAFGRGELSYSKARALTRVADVEREAELLDFARTCTAAQLERTVRAYRGALSADAGAAARAHRDRFLTWEWDDHGSLRFRGRVPAEDGALLLAALEAARDALRAEDVAEDGAGEPLAAGRRCADGDGDGDRDRAPDDAAPEDVSAETSADDSEHAPRSVDALVAMADSFLANGPGMRTGGDRHQVVVHVDGAALTDDRVTDHCELADGPAIAPETARRLCCDASIVPLATGAGPVELGRKTRTISPALRRALNTRDRTCRFPGCTQRRFLDAHHIQHWAQGGRTDLDNLVHLCRHHHRLLHEGGFRMRRSRGNVFVFRRPDGRRMPDCPPPPRLPRAGGSAAGGAGRGGGAGRRPLRPDACVPRWSGERFHLDLCVDVLMAFAPPAEAPGI